MVSLQELILIILHKKECFVKKFQKKMLANIRKRIAFLKNLYKINKFISYNLSNISKSVNKRKFAVAPCCTRIINSGTLAGANEQITL